MSCYLCGAEDFTFIDRQADLRFFPEEQFQIVRCDSCDLLYTMPKLSLEELRKYYPTGYGDHQDNVEELLSLYDPDAVRLPAFDASYGERLYAEIHGDRLTRAVSSLRNGYIRLRHVLDGKHDLLPFLLPMKEGPGNYLHVGAGAGGRFVALLKQGWNVAAIDLNKELMERWNNSPSITAFGEGIKSAQFEHDYFDVIFMSHVIEHLTDPMGELKILSRWLKPTGVFVCELPLYGTLVWNMRRRYVYYDVPRHVTHFTGKTLTWLMAAGGFEIRKKMNVPYGWGFYFSDFKRFCATGAPADCSDSEVGRTLPRHNALGYVSWLLRSSGDLCVYAVKRPDSQAFDSPAAPRTS